MTKTLAAGLALLFIAACGESGADKADTSATSPEVTTGVTSNLATVDTQREGTWGDISYGSADAPVTVIEYASLTCPHCATFKRTVFKKIKEEYIDTGKVRFVYRNYLLNRVDLAASTIARCGNMAQTKKLMDVYFDRQGEWMRGENPQDELAKLARRTVNMSRVQFDKCLSNKEMHKNLAKMSGDGRKEFNIQATPTVIVAGVVSDSLAWEDIKKAIDAKL
ncbi:MAG: DsbA family protein [Kordiimonadaceae bacterium]|nr:DsbA family protein [Kordiimonadaceae bacterium]